MGDSSFRYDIQGLADDLGVDIESISGLFISYIEEMRGESSSMKDLVKKEDWYMLQRVVHNIKGVSANLGIMDVFSEAEKFDILLKNNNTKDSEACVENLSRTINCAEEEIKKFFEQNGISI